jgi:hypothetical protein
MVFSIRLKMAHTTCLTSLMLHKNCSFFQLGKSPADLVGLFLLSKAPKRAMLKAGEHLMDNAKGNNHKEGDKP